MKNLLCISAGLALLGSSASATTLLNYLPFEGNYNDASGLNNHALPAQNPGQISFVSGFRGQGADINDPDAGANSGGSIDVQVDANPAALAGVSFGGWVNVETFEFDGFMAMDNGGWDRGITVNSSAGAFGVASGGAPTLGGAITPGSWQFVVGTFGGGVTNIYVGDANVGNPGALVSSGADSAGPGLSVIEIGRYDNQDLDGIVDEIFVFGEVLDIHQVNAMRNLQLSGLDYSPLLADGLFDLFSAGGSGVVGGVTWDPATGLSTANPGEVFDLGNGEFAVVLDGAGNGLTATIPEPSSALLAVLGGFGLLLIRRKRR